MAAALNRLLGQLNGLIAHEKQFIAKAAHELRTPLAVLRIHAQNALEAKAPADRADALRHLLNAVDRATRILTQLLTLARLEPDALELVRQDFDALAFIRGELAELAPLALQRGQELTLEADEAQTFRILGDAPSLGILLQNLVSNAVQYTPVGGRITVRLENTPEGLILRVEDNGPGVPQEEASRLFERFYRLGEGDGSGLGLSIVQRIAEMHFGRVWAEGRPGGGLAMIVELPRCSTAGAGQMRRQLLPIGARGEDGTGLSADGSWISTT
jgi:two-component system sensor histidine kinase QseC